LDGPASGIEARTLLEVCWKFVLLNISTRWEDILEIDKLHDQNTKGKKNR
jgi:hypothetical protein